MNESFYPARRSIRHRNRSRKPTLVVLGGGIRGATIAALLSLADAVNVQVVERHLAGSGTSSTNRGRLHSGTNLWRTPQAQALSVRRSRGSRLWRRLPGVVKHARPSLHCIENDQDIEPFLAFCAQHAIAARPVGASEVDRRWLRPEQFAALVEVAEYAFDPVEVTGRCLQLVGQRGGQVHTRIGATSLNRRDGRYVVGLSDGSTLHADWVINAMGRWINALQGSEALPRLDVEQHRWRLLFLKAHPAVPLLDRVITIVDAAERERCPAAIPHGTGVILGCRVGYDRVADPDDPQTGRLEPYDAAHPMDRTILDVSGRYFPPLRTPKAGISASHLYAFAGIYPRLRGVRDSVCKVYEDARWPGYLIVFGGDATTALYDALQVVDYLLGSGMNLTRSRAGLIDALIRSMPGTAHPDTGRMVWELPVEGGTAQAPQDLEAMVG